MLRGRFTRRLSKIRATLITIDIIKMKKEHVHYKAGMRDYALIHHIKKYNIFKFNIFKVKKVF